MLQPGSKDKLSMEGTGDCQNGWITKQDTSTFPKKEARTALRHFSAADGVEALKQRHDQTHRDGSPILAGPGCPGILIPPQEHIQRLPCPGAAGTASPPLSPRRCQHGPGPGPGHPPAPRGLGTAATGGSSGADAAAP